MPSNHFPSGERKPSGFTAKLKFKKDQGKQYRREIWILLKVIKLIRLEVNSPNSIFIYVALNNQRIAMFFFKWVIMRIYVGIFMIQYVYINSHISQHYLR